MSDTKLRPTSLDYSVAALAPVLIILMIGSLVAFLMTALYQGEFPARLMWILGLYTFASVLISRISIEQSRSQSLVYIALLGGATLFVAPRYFVIDGPMAFLSFPILVGFLVLIAFLADRITYDCTSVDDAGDAHGEGLLQSLGLLQRSNGKIPNAKSKRKHNPGVWVLYFAILAIPVFGLGQLVIPTAAGRRLAFACTWIYLTSALMLLVTISLLSVRSYVRQRDVAMESGMTIRWLLAGGLAVLGLMLVMAILPLPSADRSMWELPFRITSRDDLQSHRFGWGNEAPKPNPNNPVNNAPPPANNAPPPVNNAAPSVNGVNAVNEVNAVKDSKTSPTKPDTSGSDGNASGQKGDGNDSDSTGGETKPNQSSSNASSSKQSGTNQPQPNQPQTNQPQTNQPGDAKPQPNQQEPKQPGAGKPQHNQPQHNQPPPNQPPPNQPPPNQPKAAQPPPAQPAAEQPPPQSPPSSPPMQIEWNPGAAMRWLLFLILLGVAIFFGIRYRRELVAWFRETLAFWLRLFSREDVPSAEKLANDGEQAQAPMVSFADLRDPFALHPNDPDRAIKSLFDATSVWGREQRVVRRDDETPEEYVARLGRKYSPIAESLSHLGMVYSRLAYAQKRVHPKDALSLRELWQWMATHPPRSPSERSTRPRDAVLE